MAVYDLERTTLLTQDIHNLNSVQLNAVANFLQNSLGIGPTDNVIVDYDGDNSPTDDPTSQLGIITNSFIGVTPTEPVVIQDTNLPSLLVVHGTANHLIADGQGNDKVSLQDTGNDTVYLGNGNDTIWAGGGVNSILGGTGNDLFIAGTGVGSTLMGGGGNDTFAGDATDTYMDGGTGNSTLYGGSGTDTLHGGGGNALIYADNGSSYLYGDSGNSTLWGGVGSDTMYAGSGNSQLTALGAQYNALYRRLQRIRQQHVASRGSRHAWRPPGRRHQSRQPVWRRRAGYPSGWQRQHLHECRHRQ